MTSVQPIRVVTIPGFLDMEVILGKKLQAIQGELSLSVVLSLAQLAHLLSLLLGFVYGVHDDLGLLAT